MMSGTMNIDSGMETRVTSASGHEIHIMMASTPSTVSRALISCGRVCISVCEMLSMSLVTRDSSSPRGCLSKYDRGRRWSLASTSLRIRRTDFCEAPISIQFAA